MKVQAEKIAGVHRMRLAGGLTANTVEGVMSLLQESTADCQAIEIDISDVCKFDPAGFEFMLNARGESVRRGKPLKFVADKIFAQEVLDYHHMMWALTRPRYEGQQAA